MDSNITFRIDSDVKQKMSAICKDLGMSTSTAFNLFANAFVRAKGMPFPVTVQAGQQHLRFSKKDMEEAVRIESSSKAFFLDTEAVTKISSFAKSKSSFA